MLELYCEITDRRGPVGFGKRITKVNSKIAAVENDGNVIYERDAAIKDELNKEQLNFADQVYAFGLSQSNEYEKITIKGTRKSVEYFPIHKMPEMPVKTGYTGI